MKSHNQSQWVRKSHQVQLTIISVFDEIHRLQLKYIISVSQDLPTNIE